MAKVGRKRAGGKQIYARIPDDLYVEVERQNRGNQSASIVALMRDGMLWRNRNKSLREAEARKRANGATKKTGAAITT